MFLLIYTKYTRCFRIPFPLWLRSQVFHPLKGEVLIAGTTAYVTWKEQAEWGSVTESSSEDGDGEVINLWVTAAGGEGTFVAAGVDADCSVSFPLPRAPVGTYRTIVSRPHPLHPSFPASPLYQNNLGFRV